MQNTDDIFESLNWSIFRLLPDLFEDNGGKGPRNAVVIKLFFFLVVILLFVGSEAVKLIFRKGFGTKGVHWWKVILCALVFGIIGYYSLEAGLSEYEDETVLELGSQPSFVVTGIFYYLLALYLFYKGFLQRRNRDAEKYYRGESTLLFFLTKEGWSQAKIQNLAEPLTLLSIGSFFTLINPVWGVPLVFCACSSWLTYGIENLAGMSVVRDTLAKQGHQKFQSDNYSNINY